MPAWWEELVHVLTGRVRRHGDLPDLRELASRAVALERTHYLVNDSERQGRERRAYVLRCEVDISREKTEIAVFSNGRGVGYLPARAADAVRPFLERMGGAAIVNGSGMRRGSMRLWVDVPTTRALVDFFGAEEGSGNADDGTGSAHEAISSRQRYSRFSRSERLQRTTDAAGGGQ